MKTPTTKAPPLSVAAWIFIVAMSVLIPYSVYYSMTAHSQKARLSEYVCSLAKEDRRELPEVQQAQVVCRDLK